MEEPSRTFSSDDHDYYVQLFLNLFQGRIPGGGDSCIYAEIRNQLEQILDADAELAHYRVVIDSKSVLQDDVVLGHLVLRHPNELLKVMSAALVQQQHFMLEQLARSNPNINQVKSVKVNVHARIQWLPASNRKRNVSSIRAEDVGTFLQFGGTITRSGEKKVLEAMRVFECNNPKCTGAIKVHAAVNQVGGIIEKPSGKCTHCKKSSSYTENRAEAVCHDYQEIKVQEQVQKLGMGSIPRSIVVLLMHDLVDSCKPGDDVVVTGVPFHRWAQPYKDERCRLETVILANNVHVVNTLGGGTGVLNNADTLESEFEQFWVYWNGEKRKPITGRNKIISCVCPQLCGVFLVKLTVLLTMIGSPPFVDQHGNRVRGQPHLLLIGDPGTGKSQFLRFAAKLSPRAVLTTGVGTTSAGLTCTAVREGSDFVLEAGALVLADRGLCCIDEFGSIRSHERSTILEAMEQQTLSVAKAGIVCKLNTRTTIIAACNPKGKYDPMANIVTNVGIETPLLSRFDLVLVMLDVAEDKWDREVSEHILMSHLAKEAEEPSCGPVPEGVASFGSPEEDDMPGASQASAMWDIDKLQNYIAYVKKIEPDLSDDAGQVLQAYYKAQRNYDLHLPASGRTTLRLLESLIRISKAHARLMARDIVLLADAITAVFLVELSMNTFDAIGQVSVVNYQEPLDAESSFLEIQEKVLRNLKLEHLGDGPDCTAFNSGPPSFQASQDERRSQGSSSHERAKSQHMGMSNRKQSSQVSERTNYSIVSHEYIDNPSTFIPPSNLGHRLENECNAEQRSTSDDSEAADQQWSQSSQGEMLFGKSPSLTMTRVIRTSTKKRKKDFIDE